MSIIIFTASLQHLSVDRTKISLFFYYYIYSKITDRPFEASSTPDIFIEPTTDKNPSSYLSSCVYYRLYIDGSCSYLGSVIYYED